VFIDSIISITVPKELSVQSDQLQLTAVQSIRVDNTIRFSFNETTNTIEISNAFPSAYTKPTLVEFVINSGIQNAKSTEPTGAFTVKTLDSNRAVIDYGTSKALLFTPNEIPQIVTTACADKSTPS
jgi:hypothetical protein